MRALALSGFAVLAMSVMAPAAVWAFSTEQVSPNGGASANLAEQEDPLKALQDKVDSKGGSKPNGFYFSAGSGPAQPFGPGFRSNQMNGTAPFGYSPMPGFREQPQ